MPEIELAVVARIRDELAEEMDAEGLAVLRPAATESVTAALNAIEQGESWTPAVPPAVIAQIRYLARQGMPLEVVVRGYQIVFNVFLEFLGEEVADLPQAQEALRYALSVGSRHGDQLLSAFVAEHTDEVERLNRSPSRHLAERVQKLLAGGPGEAADLGYSLDAWHVGLIAAGPKAELACRTLAERLGCELLFLPRGEDMAWAWLGARRGIGFPDLDRHAEALDHSLSLAAGEPRQGLEGWRLTHREAQAALAVAPLEPRRLTRYSDVALLASAIGDGAAGRSLLDRYLRPLEAQRDGESLRETLRTYLAMDCNAASTAATLGVDRHTVQRRLAKAERSIGRPLAECRAELDVALRLQRLSGGTAGDAVS
jgi:hypothetical protein